MNNIMVLHENLTRNASGQIILEFSCRARPDICCREWQRSRDGAVTTCREKQIVIFHVRWYPLFRTVSFVWDCFGTVLAQICFFSYFSQSCTKDPVNVMLQLISHRTGNRQLRVSYSSERWMLCRPPCFVHCFGGCGLSWQDLQYLQDNSNAESIWAGQFMFMVLCFQKSFQMYMITLLISYVSGRRLSIFSVRLTGRSHVVRIYYPDSL